MDALSKQMDITELKYRPTHFNMYNLTKLKITVTEYITNKNVARFFQTFPLEMFSISLICRYILDLKRRGV